MSPPSPGVRAVPVQIAAMRSRRERSPSPLSGDFPFQAEPVPKRAKSVESIKKEVLDLLQNGLMRAADATVKVNTLNTLRGHFKAEADESPHERQRKKEYCRVVEELNGCRFVLTALVRELDKSHPDRHVVHGALLFLFRWNTSPGRREAMSRGVDVVARAMRAFRNHAGIQHEGVGCFYYFTRDNCLNRRMVLVEADAIPLVFRVITAHGFLQPQSTKKFAVVLLRRMCELAGPHHVEGLVEQGALEALAKV